MRSDLVRIDVVRAVLFLVAFRGRDCESRPGAEFVLSFYRRYRRGRTGGRISVAALRPSAYSLEFELGSWPSSSERAWGARKRETVRWRKFRANFSLFFESTSRSPHFGLSRREKQAI